MYHPSLRQPEDLGQSTYSDPETTWNYLAIPIWWVYQNIPLPAKLDAYIQATYMEHCNRLPKEALESPSLEIFKIHLVLSNLLWVALLEHDGTRWT